MYFHLFLFWLRNLWCILVAIFFTTAVRHTVLRSPMGAFGPCICRVVFGVVAGRAVPQVQRQMQPCTGLVWPRKARKMCILSRYRVGKSIKWSKVVIGMSGWLSVVVWLHTVVGLWIFDGLIQVSWDVTPSHDLRPCANHVETTWDQLKVWGPIRQARQKADV